MNSASFFQKSFTNGSDRKFTWNAKGTLLLSFSSFLNFFVGLLWNLSSADTLRPELLKNALLTLVERVILPYTAGPAQANDRSKDPDVFFHTTGCLR